MYEKNVRALIGDTQRWLSELEQSGWVTSASVASLVDGDEIGASLFDDSDPPLVVGLFGGTGVGKSSLLNRLAGEDVARTGVVRPTSMEITAYFHERIDLSRLPSGFPEENFAQARHARDDLANVVWVDMPDFDSDETQNREQVLQWLPHIDLLVYVVTPERYRDAQGWRLLLQEGYRHAWLFVINQWDRADPVQLEDFTSLLKRAGFEQPRVYRTICSGDTDVDDDFASLAQAVSGLAQRKIIEQLHDRGWLARLLELQQRIKGFSGIWGHTAQVAADSLWRQRWQEFVAETVDNQRAAVKGFAAQFAPAAGDSLFKRVLARGSNDSARASLLAKTCDVESLWDQWARKRLQGVVDRFVSDFKIHGLAMAPLTELLRDVPADAEQRIGEQLRQRLNETVASPGPRWRQHALRLCQLLQILLPLLAVAWAGWRVMSGFIAGADDPQAYVGFNVLANAVMLAGFGWLAAWLATMVVKPSLDQWIEQDLLGQLRDGLIQLGAEREPNIEALVAQRSELDGRLREFDEQTAAILERASVLENEELTQLLLPHPDAG